MNKHIIILPILLASAVSLHVLSMYLEEPVNNITDTASASPSPSESQIAVAPTSEATPNVKATPMVKTSAKAPINVKATPKPNTSAKPVSVKATPKPEATPNVVPSSVVSTPSVGNETPLPTEQPVRIAKSGFIHPKPFSQILEEAKMVGGRLDPFLELKPPSETEEVPEIPQELKDFVENAKIASKQQNKTEKVNQVASATQTYNGKTVPKPPSFAKNGYTGSRQTQTETTLPSVKTNIIGKLPHILKDNTQSDKNNVSNNKQKGNVIELSPIAKLKDGLILTGIIIGDKPIAIMMVDNESKIFKIGDIIRPTQKLRLVSIDFRSKSVTVLDDRNRKARIEIKE